MVLYFLARRGKPPIWLAMDRKGSAIEEEGQLPSNAFAARKQAAK